MEKDNTISVVGLGKLGMPLCAVLASKGYKVIGVDTNQQVVKGLNEGKTLINEPGLQSLIDAHHHSLSATMDYALAIQHSDVTFIIVPTPSNENGHFSNAYVLDAIRKIGPALKNKTAYHLVVIVSTVMPGSMDVEIRQAIEAASQRMVGLNLGLCYSPEFIALGDVIKNMLFPDMVLIGESDHQSGALLEAIYKNIAENNAPIIKMNLMNAEITKIAVNTFVTTKISFANMLSDLCDRLPNADVNVVTNAMAHDSRIGKKYLKAATGYGGPCFPRDNVAFVALMNKLGAHADIAKATDTINHYQIQRLLAMTEKYGSSKKIGILGLSYKPFTNVVEESVGIQLANKLLENGYTVSVYDPMALSEAQKKLHATVILNETIDACVSTSDILIITTPWPEFQQALSKRLVARPSSPRIIIDCWRILAEHEYVDVAELQYLGYGNHHYTQSNGIEGLTEWTKMI